MSQLRSLARISIAAFFLSFSSAIFAEGIPFYYWGAFDGECKNFGDVLSLKLVERMTKGSVQVIQRDSFHSERKMLAVGSILQVASENDVIWGSGINGKHPRPEEYHFSNLDVRAVRGPLTRQFLMKNFGIDCPEVYGDPILLMPYFFPEFKRKDNPLYDFLIVPHYYDMGKFPKGKYINVVYPTDPWEEVMEKILNSRFVISTSLHGIVVAEAFGIPARMLRVSEHEPLFKYSDYYFGTGRFNFQVATSIEEALRMGGEIPFQCDLKKLYEAFPSEFWPSHLLKVPDFLCSLEESVKGLLYNKNYVEPSSPYESSLVHHVKQSFEKAMQKDSKLKEENFLKDMGPEIARRWRQEGGFNFHLLKKITAIPYYHLLNNLCELEGASHLHIGLLGGDSFIAALYGNQGLLKDQIGIDWFKECPEKIVYFNCKKYLDLNSCLIVNSECCSADRSLFKKPIDIYFYDADHTQHKKAITYYDEILAEVFILVIDDWNYWWARQPTFEAFDQLEYRILYEAAIPLGYGNGQYIAVIKKRYF